MGRGSGGHGQLSRIAVLFLSLTVVGGCSSRVVHVENARGVPLPGATVSAVALSIEGLPKTTGARGDADLPATIEEARWIKVEKPGFKTVYVLKPDAWPLRVTLLPHEEDGAE